MSQPSITVSHHFARGFQGMVLRAFAITLLLITLGCGSVPEDPVPAISASPPPPPAMPAVLESFEPSPHFGELIHEYDFDPDARVHINAPEDFDPALPTEVIFYALPNGNTIEQTIGQRMTEGLDWHFDIQHIGAQVRFLREIIDDRNIVVVYLEASPRSWPTWRRNHENSSDLIAHLLEKAFPIDEGEVTWDLTSHSGGGSLVFGFLNGVEEIPDQIERIVFLDSDYSYSDEDRHGEKLLRWLERSPEHHLVVVAYDDRNITFNGQRVVSDTGGTYRATTERMLPRLSKYVTFDHWTEGDLLCWRGMDGQIDIRVHTNPENSILHTVLVGEMNGLIHALTVDTPHEEEGGGLRMGRAYEDWIQDGD